MKKIVAEQLIHARSQNRIFVEKADARRLSAADAEKKYGLRIGKGNAFIEFDVEPKDLRHRKNPQTQIDELFIVGNVNLKNRNPEARVNY